jgi:hypothetical protein
MTTTLKPPTVAGRRMRRATGAAALTVLVTLVAAQLVGARTDVGSQASLQVFLDHHGARLFVAWVLTVLGGLAWLGLITGMRRLLPGGGARDLFVAAGVAGQAIGWAGASLGTAAAAPDARDIPLSVYNAFGEAAHLASAAGIAATGLALIGLGAAASGALPVALPRFVARLTTAAGVLLILTGPIGPISLPVNVFWLLTLSIVLLRRPTDTAAPVAGRA